MDHPRRDSTSSSALGPDNRCCFCLTLKAGSVVVAIANFLVNVFAFSWYEKMFSPAPFLDARFRYATSPAVRSGLGRPSEPLTRLDILVLTAFLAEVGADAFLVLGALRKSPRHMVPWLCANALLMGVLLVLVAFLLLFGYVRLSLRYDQYVSSLSLAGCLAAAHFFSCLVVYQHRRNMLDERSAERRRRRRQDAQIGEDEEAYPGMEGPLPSAGEGEPACLSQNGVDEDFLQTLFPALLPRRPPTRRSPSSRRWSRRSRSCTAPGRRLRRSTRPPWRRRRRRRGPAPPPALLLRRR